MSVSTLLSDQHRLLTAIILCLNQLLAEQQTRPHCASPLDLKSSPTISVGDYITRTLGRHLGIHRYMNCSVAVFVNAVALLDRAQENNPEFVIHPRNIHRLVLIANVVSAKYLDDLFFKNSFYANVGGVPLKVLNELEAEFLKLVNFNCHVELPTLEAYMSRLETFEAVSEREEGEEARSGTK